MTAVDTNVLVYAYQPETPLHDAARSALGKLAEGDDIWALPIFALGEFLRVVTHPRIVGRHADRRRAVAFLEPILESPTLLVLSPRERFFALLREAMDGADARGNLVFDAQIVAVCREHGVGTLLTEDRDFRRFPGVHVQTLS